MFWRKIKHIWEHLFRQQEPIRKEEAKPEVIKKTNIPSSCQARGCNNKITLLEGFKCRYCFKWFCPDHRIPENHSCKGNPISIPKAGVERSGRITGK